MRKLRIVWRIRDFSGWSLLSADLYRLFNADSLPKDSYHPEVSASFASFWTRIVSG